MVRESHEAGAGSVTVTMSGMGQGVKRLWPVATYVVPYGLAFGAAAVDRGLTEVQSVVMSAIVFAGASQFAALEMWGESLPYLSLALVTLAVNSRLVILGAVLSPWLNALPRRHALAAMFLLSDPNFADGHSALKSGSNDVGILIGGGLLLWSVWVTSTWAGAVVGATFGALDRFGIDVAMATFFASVVAGKATSRASVVPAAVAVVVCLATFDVLPNGWSIIAAALCGGATGLLVHAK